MKPWGVMLALVLAFIPALAMPALANSQESNNQASNNEEACMVIHPATNIENVFIGPGSFLACQRMLQEDPTNYPTQRPPDSILCGTRYGKTMVIAGLAFNPSQTATVTCTPGALWKAIPVH